MYKKVFLVPQDGRKSFYGKCYAEEIGDTVTLYSYSTKIATYNRETGELVKHGAFNYSQTTRRHQKAFFIYYNISA